MATETLETTLDPPISELRAATMTRILVIEHDNALRKILRRLFSSEGYEIDMASGGMAGLEMLRRKTPSAVILDLPYPEASGSELCREIVNSNPALPLLVLGASSDVADQVLLLETGADDYVPIPFNPRELAERLRAVMRRASRTAVL